MKDGNSVPIIGEVRMNEVKSTKLKNLANFPEMTSLRRKWARKVGWGQPHSESSDYTQDRYIDKIYLSGACKRVF